MISRVEFDKIFDDLAHFAGITVEKDYGISTGEACPTVYQYIYDVRDNQCWNLIAIFEYPNDCLGRTNAELSNKVVDVVEQHFHMKLEDMLYMDNMDKMNKFELTTSNTFTLLKDSTETIKRLTNSYYGIKPTIYDYTQFINWRFYTHLIDRVIFNDPATIILWKSGEKTVVKCGPNEEFDKEKGLAMALCKYFLGNKGNFNEFFKKFMEEEK